MTHPPARDAGPRDGAAAEPPRPIAIGPLVLASPVALAPMAGYTDLAFRASVRGLGGLGLAFTEMINPDSVLRGGGRRRKALLATDAAEDRPLGFQVYGHDPLKVAEAARWLEQYGADLIDINMGCPQRKIAGRGDGAGLLREPDLAVRVAAETVRAVRIPVTVKIRLGWDRERLVAPALAPALEAVGVAAITVHGRTGGQGYMGQADWAEIGSVARSVRAIPVFGNGDVIAAAGIREKVQAAGCAGVMVGRGALRNPWLVRDLAAALAGRPIPPPPAPQEKAEFLAAHFQRHLGLYGERGGVLLFRKWIAQYVRGFGLSRDRMIALMAVADAAEMKRALDRVFAGEGSDSASGGAS